MASTVAPRSAQQAAPISVWVQEQKRPKVRRPPAPGLGRRASVSGCPLFCFLQSYTRIAVAAKAKAAKLPAALSCAQDAVQTFPGCPSLRSAVAPFSFT